MPNLNPNPTQSMETPTPELWNKVRSNLAALRKEIARVVVGQDQIVDQMLAALLCRGHCLIIGVPGLAKTLLVRTLGQTLGLSFRRIQFTPDLMPTDILGSEILQTSASGERRFEFVKGPVFANLILADEINRTPPKTQSALLEAMQEKQVTVAGNSLALEEPFVVFATQNPIEHEGTYPLPEAQLDRFFFSLSIDYPSLEEERKIVLHTTQQALPVPNPILQREEILELQTIILRVPVPDHVLDSITRLVHSSRPNSGLAEDYVKKYVAWGAGPRASQYLTLAAKAFAIISGNTAASIEEVRLAALPVLRHRIIPNYNATGEGISSENIIQKLLEKL
jgi:MoxR-like ATPase